MANPDKALVFCDYLAARFSGDDTGMAGLTGLDAPPNTRVGDSLDCSGCFRNCGESEVTGILPNHSSAIIFIAPIHPPPAAKKIPVY